MLIHCAAIVIMVQRCCFSWSFDVLPLDYLCIILLACVGDPIDPKTTESESVIAFPDHRHLNIADRVRLNEIADWFQSNICTARFECELEAL